MTSTSIHIPIQHTPRPRHSRLSLPAASELFDDSLFDFDFKFSSLNRPTRPKRTSIPDLIDHGDVRSRILGRRTDSKENGISWLDTKRKMNMTITMLRAEVGTLKVQDQMLLESLTKCNSIINQMKRQNSLTPCSDDDTDEDGRRTPEILELQKIHEKPVHTSQSFRNFSDRSSFVTKASAQMKGDRVLSRQFRNATISHIERPKSMFTTAV